MKYPPVCNPTVASLCCFIIFMYLYVTLNPGFFIDGNLDATEVHVMPKPKFENIIEENLVAIL